ncbi:leucyl/phenylalanyl-tRNA--protein transferase [Shigella sonnei]|nr:leucyl/phenylalanyl-tRNA--protein transferase [Shigella sonnei]
MRLVQLSRHSIAFPSPEGALREPNGLLALGGDLSPARLLMAYQRGIFPWFSPGAPILWWSPDPRAVLWPESLHISRSMKRFHKRSPYRVTMNYAFGQVIEGCASDREEGTWITRGVVEAYHRLHELGHAHSIEVWHEDELVGGMYGVAQGTLYRAFSDKWESDYTGNLTINERPSARWGSWITITVNQDVIFQTFLFPLKRDFEKTVVFALIQTEEALNRRQINQALLSTGDLAHDEF